MQKKEKKKSNAWKERANDKKEQNNDKTKKLEKEGIFGRIRVIYGTVRISIFFDIFTLQADFFIISTLNYEWFVFSINQRRAISRQ